MSQRGFRKNPYTFGTGASLLALGGLAAIVMRVPAVSRRARELKRAIIKRVLRRREDFAQAVPIEHHIVTRT